MNEKPPAHWRPMNPADLPAVLAIADIVHPAYPEEPAIFAERLALYPAGCLVLEDAGNPAGYIISHPWFVGDPPGLNSRLCAIPVNPTTYYIHDIALLPRVWGIGAAAAAIERLTAHAASRGFPSLSLIAVNGSAGFWGRHGFRVVENPDLDAKLRSYDAGARFMIRAIAQTQSGPTL
jgi:GNAT superfamily N-acetyltransferase